MPKQFKLLIFDWDGTLVDSETQIVATLQQAITQAGVSPLPEAALRDVIGLSLHTAIQRLLPEADVALCTRITTHYRAKFLADTHPPFFPGMAEMLTELVAAGYQLAVATGKGRRGLNRGLAQLQVAQLFHATRCADETASKPDPQMLQEILAELEVAPAQALMIGDTEYDMAMAQAAGVDRLAVCYGVHAPERLWPYAPLACLADLRDLPHWLATAA